MIRFIDLGDQILEGQREFAFFDTTSDTFVGFGHEGDQPEYTFHSVEVFKQMLQLSPPHIHHWRPWLEYIPENFFDKKE